MSVEERKGQLPMAHFVAFHLTWEEGSPVAGWFDSAEAAQAGSAGVAPCFPPEPGGSQADASARDAAPSR